MTNTTTPNDAQALKAWAEIMKVAEQHGLIVAAVDGVATLALPAAQREHGWFERCRYNAGLGPHPDSSDARAQRAVSSEVARPDARVSESSLPSAALAPALRDLVAATSVLRGLGQDFNTGLPELTRSAPRPMSVSIDSECAKLRAALHKHQPILAALQVLDTGAVPSTAAVPA